jgi:hypothetical protein
MPSFIEELSNGDCFESNDSRYVLTCDFKSNRSRLSINLSDGNARWFNSNDIVDKIPIFYTNKDNHMVAIKESKKDAIN